ncbi:PREDICTED: nuclear hormone receptor HR96-like [Priapulus caudatus]|uniref:Nuclear hormone receptor HR96-like n=1 Tax=Priapulus caudatus TaxID=37621 RepID=A0ABM1EWP1_PRICU|nr:PREDICTED: nuclear hormone receptor HR96-like [Priapulus caudatus]
MEDRLQTVGEELTAIRYSPHGEVAVQSPQTPTQVGTVTAAKAKKICKVCGDSALGYNFNAVTCESCKAFFRRNALKDQDKFKCPFQGSCKVDLVTRRFCQKCRLDKCFIVGMKKEWIMTDDDKKVKRKKSEENRHRRKRVASGDAVATISSTVPHLPASPLSLGGADVLQYLLHGSAAAPPAGGGRRAAASPQNVPGIQTFMPAVAPPGPTSYLDELNSPLVLPTEYLHGYAAANPGPHYQPANPSYQPGGDGQQGVFYDGAVSSPATASGDYKITYEPTGSYTNLDSVRTTSSSGGSLTSSHDDAGSIGTPATPVASPHAPAADATYGCVAAATLDEHDATKVEELLAANRIMLAPPDSDWKVESNTLIDVINLTNSAVRRMIKMAKKMGCFKSLGEDDQVALLKGGCTELMILRSVMAYDYEKDCWPLPDNPLRLNVLKEAKGNLYEEHKKYIHSFEPHLRADVVLMLIISAIRLFCPTRPKLVNRATVRCEQDYYYALLQRYLETKYTRADAQLCYRRLLDKLTALHDLNENHVRIFLDVNPKDVEPLIIELFDLKPSTAH